MTLLTVGKAAWEDISRDRVRIHLSDRPQGVDRHHIAKIEVGGISRLVEVLGNETPSVINIDIDNRQDLGDIGVGKTYEFTITKVMAWRRLCWLWQATDPVIRVPAKVALWSMVLTTIAPVISLPSLSQWLAAFVE